MPQERQRVGLLGYGAIGQAVAHLIATQASEELVLVGTLVKHAEKERPAGPPLFLRREAFLAADPHLVVEVAGHAGLREHGAAILQAGIPLFLVSAGVLADPVLLDAFQTSAHLGKTGITIVPGAIGALDMLAAAAFEGNLALVRHTMQKPPETLLPPEEARMVRAPQEIFRGTARQAMFRFPTFLNVAAAVALAGKGFDQTEVVVIADPAVEQSIHTVLVEGPFGHFHFTVTYLPDQVAALVAQSIIYTLLRRERSLIIGS